MSPVWDAHVIAHLSGDRVVVAGGEGVWISDATLHDPEWKSTGGFEGVYATGLAVDTDGRCYLATRGHDAGALWESADGGESWSVVPGTDSLEEPGHGVHAVTCDPIVARHVFYGAGTSITLVTERGARELASSLPVIRRLVVVEPKALAPRD
ncbi:MAG: hypothetical protein AAF581_14695 [Planctomycetota bacterium]